MTPTPIWHATVAGVLSGLAFPIGDDWFFTGVDDPRVYRVTHLRVLTMTDQVEAQAAERLTAEVIEPRLLAMTGGKAA